MPGREKMKAVVVEDEETLRDLAAAMLEETDLDVLEFSTAEDALDYMAGHGDEVALVFADVWLGGEMDGVDLARAVRRRWPRVDVLITSGAGGDRVRDMPDGAIFMPKPWRALEVLISAERATARRH